MPEATERLRSQYPPHVRAKIGELKPEMTWVKGYEILEPCKD
jgi:hypothetical protein